MTWDEIVRWNDGVVEAISLCDDSEWRNFLRGLLI